MRKLDNKFINSLKRVFQRREDRQKRRDSIVGIFEESEGNKSMTRVLTFMTTTTAVAIIIMQEVANLLITDYETNLAAPSLLLGYSAGKKLTQKHMETRHVQKGSPNEEVVDDMNGVEGVTEESVDFDDDRQEVIEEL